MEVSLSLLFRTFKPRLVLCMLAVQQERTHQNLLSGVEHFDKSSMKHATTTEKNVLPDSEGK